MRGAHPASVSRTRPDPHAVAGYGEGVLNGTGTWSDCRSGLLVPDCELHAVAPDSRTASSMRAAAVGFMSWTCPGRHGRSRALRPT